MSRGTIFVKLLVSFSLLVTLFATSAPAIFRLNRELLFFSQQGTYDNQVQTAVNRIYFELKGSKLINMPTHRSDSQQVSFISIKGEPTTYHQKNNRLARTTGGTFYLTPKQLKITDFAVTYQQDLIQISFSVSADNYQRKVTRTLELINV